jgi:signal transduction histidine kinase
MLKTILYRPVWIPVAITAGALLLALLLLVTNAWRGIERLQPVHNHLDRITRLQATSQHLQKILLDHLLENNDISATSLKDIHSDLDKLLNSMDQQADKAVVAPLRQAQQAVDHPSGTRKQALIEALNKLNAVLQSETHTHDNLLREARNTAKVEFSVATTTLVALPSLAMIILFMVRKRILTPINSLAWLMSQLALARNDTTPSPPAVSTEIDPVLKPLIEHYNAMVQRLAQLEREHQNRHQTLESQVRSAATSLLDQQRSLAKAEQLAAVGELAARLAHELRNPLAGMQMAITNLQHEIGDAEHMERLALVAAELERIIALLNGLLAQAHLRPEPLRSIRVAQVVRELLTLARYQLPERITLEQEIAEDLEWRLPENELRRSLLNLVLNACQAMGEQAGKIWVSLRAEENHLLMEVCDDGPGFPAAILDSGVRSFHTTRTDGTGLGLSSVQRFVQELHGELQLRNREPHGACVVLRIPSAGEAHV